MADAGSLGELAESVATPTAFSPQTPTTLPPARPLTEPGCCVRPWWSADSTEVLFLDRPDSSSPASVYSLSIADGRTLPSLVPLGIYDDRGRLIARPGPGVWELVPADGSTGWTLPAGTRSLRVSHGRDLAAWSEGSNLPVNIDRRQRAIWVAGSDGQDRRKLIQVTGGDLLGWTPNDDAVVVSGTPPGETQPGVWRIGLAGPPSLLFGVDRVRNPLLSPDGGWLAFMIAFSGDRDRDGVWVLELDTGEAHRLEVFGSYRWRSEGSLLILPLSLEPEGLSLLEVNTVGRESRPLLPAGSLPGAVANNDWQPSPDGRWLLYLHAEEGNLWLASLP